MADAQIYFAGDVNQQTMPPLIAAVSDRVGRGARSVLIAISSAGGNIYWGVTAYNFLRGLGVEVTTHNVGIVDSIAGVIYCAGQRRLCVPEGRFLIHGVAATFVGTNPSFGEKDLQSRVAGLAKDRETIATILASRTGKALGNVMSDMLNETYLGADDAKAYGLVTEVTADVFDPGQEIVRIGV